MRDLSFYFHFICVKALRYYRYVINTCDDTSYNLLAYV